LLTCKHNSFFEDTSSEIVRFYGVCLEPAVCLVMEFCERYITRPDTLPTLLAHLPLTHALSALLFGMIRGSLHGVLKDEKTDMSWEMAISFIQATVRGIHLLHTSQPQVLHRCGRSHVTPIKADIFSYFHCECILGTKRYPRTMAHRDLKTLNLLVTHDWQIKVADFGLARANTKDNQSTLARLCGTNVSFWGHA